LAATGFIFNNAYTPSPICIPARQCMMAGQLPKTGGCEGWFDLEPGYRTFAREFSRHTRAPGTGKWSNQKEVEEARVANGPYQ
jgi:arylsulfatase A-like enzyme